MDVVLISKDKRLHRLCHETLAGFAGRSWNVFVVASADEWTKKADLYIWDFEPAMALPRKLEFGEEQNNVFLVNRSDLEAFRDHLPLAAVSILLKPVNQPALRSFLEHATARHDALKAAGQGGRLEELRFDRDTLLQSLLQANLRLQEYDQDRTNFLARAVHDFRAPLTAIGGYCGLMLGERLGPLTGAQSEVLKRMQYSVKRLSRMATAMFQLSVGRHMDSRLDIKESDIEECVAQAVHEIVPQTEEKGITLNVQLEPPEQRLYFDSSQILQALVNLLDNACKFTPKGGFITVQGMSVFWNRRAPRIAPGNLEVERRNGDLRAVNAYRVQVSDSGPGVPVENLEKIFEEYTSYAGSQDRSGGGLGLAICKMIMKAHQGQMFAESSRAGATFAFVLPNTWVEQRPGPRISDAEITVLSG